MFSSFTRNAGIRGAPLLDKCPTCPTYFGGRSKRAPVMIAVMFTPGPDGHTVRFAYDPEVVAAIKQTVPGYARSWRPHTKLWTVDPVWVPVLADTLRALGQIVTGLQPPPRQAHGDADWARAL